jgi:hypothetical protein
MTKPVPDKAEVALEFSDKLYIGTFERSSRFDAHLDANGIAFVLERTGDADTRKSVHMHFHYALFANMLADLAKSVSAMLPDDAPHRDALRQAAQSLVDALAGPANAGDKPDTNAQRPRRTGQPGNDVSQLTPDDEVLLLHVME